MASQTANRPAGPSGSVAVRADLLATSASIPVMSSRSVAHRGNTDRKRYSPRLVSVSSVNVMANPVRVAPIPKVIAHVPTNIIITTSGVGL